MFLFIISIIFHQLLEIADVLTFLLIIVLIVHSISSNSKQSLICLNSFIGKCSYERCLEMGIYQEDYSVVLHIKNIKKCSCSAMIKG